MSELLSLVPADGWPRFAWDCIGQSTLLGLGAWLIAGRLIRQPVRRAWLLLLEMLVRFVAPPPSAASRQANLGISADQDRPPAPLRFAESGPHETTILTASDLDPERNLNPCLVPGVLWAIASSSLAARLSFSAVGTWRPFRRSVSRHRTPILASATRAAAAVGLTREPRFLRLVALRQTPEHPIGSRWRPVTGIAALFIVSGVALAQVTEDRGTDGEKSHSVPDDSVPRGKTGRKPMPYLIGPNDVLRIDARKATPKPPYHIQPLDRLQILVQGMLLNQPIKGPFNVDSSGTVDLGPVYGKVKVAGMTCDEATDAVAKQLRTVLPSPEASVTLEEASGQQQISGEHLVGPDGKVKLGHYGSVRVAGMTLDEAQKAIEDTVSKDLLDPKIDVTIYGNNSQVIYLVVEEAGGNRLSRLPWTGHETVLYVLAGQKLLITPQTKIWILRPKGSKGKDQKIDVDWSELVGGESGESNQLQPSDRLFVANPGRAKPTAGDEK